MPELPEPRGVSLRTDPDGGHERQGQSGSNPARDVAATGGDVGSGLDLARRLGREAPLPGRGSTDELWSLLGSIAAVDVTVARIVEPHLDALAILGEQAATGELGEQAATGELGRPGAPRDTDRTWGVFAAEGPGMRLEAQAATGDDATPGRTGGSGETDTAPPRWTLNGTKPWCSLAGRLDAALVTAWLPDGERRLFAVDLRHAGVHVLENSWHATGLAAVESGPVRFDDVPATAVGEAGWYLQRDGFAWGGIGVAACWWGGAVGIARALTAAAARREPDQIGLLAIGAVDAALTTARLALADAARQIDAGLADGAAGALLAQRTRLIVAEACESVITRVARALGPAPLALDAEHARRVADLSLYLRQHHSDRDDAVLGRTLLEKGTSW
ncbi:acyl-CoA dehydrogenase family protein [Frigoribacterium sp. 2-23]|uniref:acyl-CoA dehydrogenase family protein n=1 Tax=Frigoribacterium sp. 2-23 TaxID=3415006 RepID=UPI003C702981